MKASFITESILFWLARGVSLASQILPPRLNVAIGAGAGTLLYRLFSSRRATALANLRAAFGPALTPEEADSIVRGLFQNLGRTFMEVAATPRMDRAYVERWVSIAAGSRQRLERALSAGKGVILLTAHFGNWELGSVAGALHGFPMLVLARPQGWPRLNRLLTEYRQSKGCRVIAKGFPIRQMIRGLREGQIVGILGDQDGGRNGVLWPFFGRIASTAPGTFGLSVRTGAPVLPVFMVREGGPAHQLVVEEPLPIPEAGSVEDRVRQGVGAYLSVLERYVRRYPTQWLWLHRRWKSTPQRRLLVLDDGKPGHLNQALGFAERFEEAWVGRVGADPRLRGVPRPLVSVTTARVSYRHPLCRWALDLVACLVPRRFPGGDRWMRWALTPQSYRTLRSAHGDVGISCGASTAAVNVLWAGGLRARTVHITRPRMPSWRRFDLVVIPRHDFHPSPPPSPLKGEREKGEGPKNFLVVDGALSPRRGSSWIQAQAWKLRLGLSKGRRIGLLVGGPTRGLRLDPADVQAVVVGLIEAAERTDAELLVTSSRRTPPEIERRLEEMLGQHPRCRLLTLVNRPQAGGLIEASEAVPCILELAGAMVVSGDSISMVSEAADQAKPVVAFLPKGDGLFSRRAKYRRFLQQMDARGKVRLVEPAEVGEAVVQAVRSQESGVGSRKTPDSELRTPHSIDPVVEFLRRWV